MHWAAFSSGRDCEQNKCMTPRSKEECEESAPLFGRSSLTSTYDAGSNFARCFGKAGTSSSGRLYWSTSASVGDCAMSSTYECACLCPTSPWSR